MHAFWQTPIIVLAMFLVTLFCGSLPNLVSNPKNMHLLSVVGGGFMMGTALIIVLPESVKLIVDAHQS